MKHKINKLQKYMKKHSLIFRDISHWAILITTAVAVATSMADVSAKHTLDVFIVHPEIAENSLLVKVGYLPSFK